LLREEGEMHQGSQGEGEKQEMLLGVVKVGVGLLREEGEGLLWSQAEAEKQGMLLGVGEM
jgi:hypothetical protein